MNRQNQSLHQLPALDPYLAVGYGLLALFLVAAAVSCYRDMNKRQQEADHDTTYWKDARSGAYGFLIVSLVGFFFSAGFSLAGGFNLLLIGLWIPPVALWTLNSIRAARVYSHAQRFIGLAL